MTEIETENKKREGKGFILQGHIGARGDPEAQLVLQCYQRPSPLFFINVRQKMKPLAADLKERMDQLQVLKSNYVNEHNDLMEEIYKIRCKVDRIVSERSFLNRREQSEELAFESAKGGFQTQMQR